jgi:hypothetical protein
MQPFRKFISATPGYTVEPAYNDIGLYDTSHKKISVVPISLPLLTTTFYSLVITTLQYKTQNDVITELESILKLPHLSSYAS